MAASLAAMFAFRSSTRAMTAQDFVMAEEDDLFPAHGHRAESREKFRLPIKGSFAGVALQSGKVQASNKLSADDRYHRHPRADADRKYESMVSVPLWQAGKIDGVLNVIATRQDAFSAVDRTYITLLASVIDVARTVAGQHP
jgi:putative methionine-R-sulfoxide reductase with GAF domain